ncbi:MAG: hypothetical protein ABIP28_11860 [Mucilaginibacter sp.]
MTPAAPADMVKTAAALLSFSAFWLASIYQAYLLPDFNVGPVAG